MAHATAGIIRTVHSDWAVVISSIINAHHDGLVARELVKQLIDKRFNVKDAAQIAVCTRKEVSESPAS
jgi:hypothetical protein